MVQRDKLIKRLKTKPNNFTWDELLRLLEGFGYEQNKGGITGGSRRRFVHSKYANIVLHKPHPTKILKLYQLKQIIEVLRTEGLL